MILWKKDVDNGVDCGRVITLDICGQCSSRGFIYSF